MTTINPFSTGRQRGFISLSISDERRYPRYPFCNYHRISVKVKMVFR